LGDIININLNIPYRLNFKTTAANIILPDKGDSTWAFNNQPLRYITGVLTANAKNIPKNISSCVIYTNPFLEIIFISVHPDR
jgi:hypothetical protein